MSMVARNRSEEQPVDPVEFEPKTEFGRKLKALRAEIIASGLPLLSDEEAERELAERRGGVLVGEDRADVR
jgi:hypothetical protein